MRSAAERLARHLFGDNPAAGNVGVSDHYLFIYTTRLYYDRGLTEWEGVPVVWRIGVGKVKVLAEGETP